MISNPIDLLLIRPSDKKKIYAGISMDLPAIEPPLWGILLGAFVREQGFMVKFIDMEVEHLTPEDISLKIKEISPVAIGLIITGNNLSASTWNMCGARAVASAIKAANDQKLFMWGLHPSALPEKTLKEEPADFVIEGEGFTTIIELLKELRKGNREGPYKIRGLWWKNKKGIHSAGRELKFCNLDDLPMPAWDLIPVEKYRAHNWQCFDDIEHREPYAVLYTSLGCPWRCTFCNLSALTGGHKVRYRSQKKVVEEVELLVNKYRVRHIKILDECFILNEKHVTDLCDLIIEKKFDLNMWGYARIDTVNPKILKKLKNAGFNWVCYGIESGNRAVRESSAKGNFTQEKIREIIKITKDTGINIIANFMLGLPDDTMETMQDTLDLAIELNCEYTNFYVTMAYPGSQLYYDAIKNSVKLPDTWLGYSQLSEETLPLPTKYINAKEVLRSRDKAFYDFHNNPRYLEMIKKKFGDRVVEHIKNLLKYKIKRKYA